MNYEISLCTKKRGDFRSTDFYFSASIKMPFFQLVSVICYLCCPLKAGIMLSAHITFVAFAQTDLKRTGLKRVMTLGSPDFFLKNTQYHLWYLVKYLNNYQSDWKIKNNNCFWIWLIFAPWSGWNCNMFTVLFSFADKGCFSQSRLHLN